MILLLLCTFFLIFYLLIIFSELLYLFYLRRTSLTIHKDYFSIIIRISLSVIKDWDVSNSYSHLAGGMTYKDGKLTVPTPGRYYIYAQIYYLNNGRVLIRVNSKVVTVMQPRVQGSDQGALYTGGVFNLKAGDVITLDTSPHPVSTIKIYMYAFHTYFGAFLI